MILALVALATLGITPMPSPVEPPTTTVELPPVFDEPLEEAPTTTTPEATATPSAVAPASSPSTLPHTGTNTAITIAAGVGALVAAGWFIAGARRCRNREDIR